MPERKCLLYDGQFFPYTQVMRNAPERDPTVPAFGLACRGGEPRVMDGMHRHSEVEMNWVEAGEMTYLFGGAFHTLVAGELALFWGAVPHQVVATEPHTRAWWLTVPLAWVLPWRLPEGFTQSLLNGTLLVDRDGAGRTRDAARFTDWQDDLAPGAGAREAIVLLEVEARIRRLAAVAVTPPAARATTPVRGTELHHVERMAQYIAMHYTESLSISVIAAAVGLHPGYAMPLFRAAFGVTLGNYLTQHRVAHAQRLLVTTEMAVVTVAFASGFGSVSRFYTAFSAACGQSPRAYRTAHRRARAATVQ